MDTDLDAAPGMGLLVLLLAVAAGTLAGVVGFGSAVILLPVCTLAFGPRATVPILTIAALLGNLSRAWFSRREVDLRAAALYLLGGIPGALVGARLFVRIDTPGLPLVFGSFLILAVPGRRWARRARLTLRRPHLPLLGAAMGLLSALVSTTGPVNAPFFLALGLTGGAYLGTEALGAAGVHLAKALAYGRLRVGGPDELLAGLGIGAALSIGAALGRRLVERLPAARFVRLVEALLILSGLLLIGEGVAGLVEARAGPR